VGVHSTNPSVKDTTVQLLDVSPEVYDRLIEDANRRNVELIASSNPECWRDWYAPDAFILTEQGFLTVDELIAAFQQFTITGAANLTPTIRKLAASTDDSAQQIYFGGTVTYFLIDNATGQAMRMDERWAASGRLTQIGDFLCHFESIDMKFTPVTS